MCVCNCWLVSHRLDLPRRVDASARPGDGPSPRPQLLRGTPPGALGDGVGGAALRCPVAQLGGERLGRAVRACRCVPMRAALPGRARCPLARVRCVSLWFSPVLQGGRPGRALLRGEPRATRASVDSRLCGASPVLAGAVAVVSSSGTSVSWTHAPSRWCFMSHPPHPPPPPSLLTRDSEELGASVGPRRAPVSGRRTPVTEAPALLFPRTSVALGFTRRCEIHSEWSRGGRNVCVRVRISACADPVAPACVAGWAQPQRLSRFS